VLDDHTRSAIKKLRFVSQAAAAISGETREVLFVIHDDGQHSYLHTYDILTQQEIREPVTVCSQDILNSDLLIEMRDDMQCVVSSTSGASMVNVVNVLNCVSEAARHLYKLLHKPTSSRYDDALKLFKQHPALAFQPNTHNGRTLMELALFDAEELLCLLDPEKTVLDGTYLNITTSIVIPF
jgi:hypothetical protein